MAPLALGLKNLPELSVDISDSYDIDDEDMEMEESSDFSLDDDVPPQETVTAYPPPLSLIPFRFESSKARTPSNTKHSYATPATKKGEALMAGDCLKDLRRSSKKWQTAFQAQGLALEDWQSLAESSVGKSREKVVYDLLQFCKTHRPKLEAVFLAVQLFDRLVLGGNDWSRGPAPVAAAAATFNAQLQKLTGGSGDGSARKLMTACLLIASKLSSARHLGIRTCTKFSDAAKNEILQLELRILVELNFSIPCATAYHFVQATLGGSCDRWREDMEEEEISCLATLQLLQFALTSVQFLKFTPEELALGGIEGVAGILRKDLPPRRPVTRSVAGRPESSRAARELVDFTCGVAERLHTPLRKLIEVERA